ncbi:MAG TPA: ribosome maturation factor RimP [Longimicrobiales bacterium]
MDGDSFERELESRLEELGFELVELERAGSRARPILRLRIDVADGGAGGPRRAVTVEDCARVSRALEPYLDARGDLGDRYVLEVSSPGLERPLVRARDFERFTGEEIAVIGHRPLAGRGRRLTGRLLGLVGNGEERVRLRLENGEELEIPRAEIARAHLVFRWKGQA